MRSPFGQERHGRIVGVQSLGCEDVGADQIVDRLQRYGTGADLIGERGKADLDPFLRIALRLPVQGQMLAELLEYDHRQQVRAGPAAGRGMKGRRRLADPLAVAAGELLADSLDHFPLPGDHLQRLGDVLAHLHDARRAAAGAGGRRLDHHALARQMLGKRLARGTAALEGGDRRLLDQGFGPGVIVAEIRLEILELHLQLFDQPGMAFGTMAVLLAPELCDLQPKMPDHLLGSRNHGLNLGQFASGGDQFAFRSGCAGLGRSKGEAQNSDLRGCVRHDGSLPQCRRKHQ